MKTKIVLQSKEDFEAVINLMISSGRTLSPMDGTVKDYVNRTYPHYRYPLIDDNGSGCVDACNDQYQSQNKKLIWPKDSTEIVNLLFQKKYIVKNVGDYDAEIVTDGIKVGCQTISFEKFQEIVDKVTEFKKEN